MFIHFELFVMYVLTLVVHSLYIAGDRTKMAMDRTPRQVLSAYQRLRPAAGGEGTSSTLVAGASTGRGRGCGRTRSDPPPSPALDQQEDPSPIPEDHVAAMGTSTHTPSTQQTKDSSSA
jgi:hypothetical protein